ncbi:hypothetical protein ACFQY0_17720 [Haloferula chungangensis]|uniref:Uncharacterized protein n=1 Tax=Haloferula chungangensis TaxID=1048331 RepID=A0ABW2L9D0_9BACT
MKALLRKLTGRRARRIYFWGSITLLTLIVLGYQIENWRGARAWKQASERLERENEAFTIAELTPEPVPESENFFGTPSLAGIATDDEREKGPHSIQRKRLVDIYPGNPGSSTDLSPPDLPYLNEDRQIDFVEWITYARAAETLSIEDSPPETSAKRFLEALDSAHGPLFQELSEAASRPYSAVTPSFAELAEGKMVFNVGMHHIGSIVSLAKTMTLRAAAATELGDSKRAMESIQILMRLSEGMRATPNFLGAVVSFGIDHHTYRAIRQGLQSNLFDTQQLQTLERGLVLNRQGDTILRAMRGELRGALDAMDWLRQKKTDPAFLSTVIDMKNSGLNSLGLLLARMSPSGWIDQNRANLLNWSLDYMVLPARDSSSREIATKANELENLVKRERARSLSRPHNFVPIAVMPMFSNMLVAMIREETQHQFVQTACQLAGYKAAHGHYPDKLSALVPEFTEKLPFDPLDPEGKPINYQLIGEGYRLSADTIDQELTWTLRKRE